MKLDRAFGLVTLAGATALMVAAGCRVEVEELTDDTSTGSGAGGAGASVSVTSSGTVQPSTTGTGTGTSTGTGGGVPVDESTSCADAIQLDAKTNNSMLTFYDAEGIIGEPGDADYFKFDAQKGDWLQLFTDANPMDDSTMIDTVLTLYNADGSTQLAEVDDAFPRQSTDSELFYHVVADGTYCVKVWEFSDWNGDMAEGGPTYKYRVGTVPIDFAVYEQYNLDTEPNDSTSAPQSNLSYGLSQSNQNFTTFAGSFASGTDVDVYEITTPAAAVGMSTTFTPSGSDGNGSTQGPGNVSIYAADGTTMVGFLDYQKGADGFSSVPVMENTTYYLEVARPAGSAGANDSYAIKFRTTEQLNPQETNDSANDASGGAEIAVGQVSPNNAKTNSFFIGGTLTGLPDTDWWKISASEKDVIVVACSALRAGGGVVATVSLYGPDATNMLQSETETEAADILWSAHPTKASMAPITAAATGDYYVEISGSIQNANNTGNWYMCGVHVTSP
jgi:hypothetical protein